MYFCSECNAGFAKKCYLDQHVLVHTGETSCKCVYCDASCSAKTSPDGHSTRLQPVKKSYKCEWSEAEFRGKNTVIRHTKRHTRTNSYKCTECGAEYRWRSSLVKHVRKHAAYKPYKCNVCEADFLKNNELVIHMREHTAIAPYNCYVCDAAFPQKDLVIQHMIMHNT